MTFATVAAFVVQFASRLRAPRSALGYATVMIADARAEAHSTSSGFGRDLLTKEPVNSGRFKDEVFAKFADLA
ncbi:hypothetical protein MESS4_780015 [Mesorhizobium sp. STM 4661]|nr:hypothetical protein MESS4_780015 [Mesorhizobium sp. STM 4661]